ncbi:MAG TPA: hypothetical protein VJ418_14680 [Streptosporangiaceae bacterium]|nr:hypothetical protein [Streptosporangiaceae bacterium]
MTATQWATVASLATAVGTLVLAIATFASVRSANYSARAADQAARIAEQSARIAERSLMAAERPLLVSSRLQDPEQKIQFLEGTFLKVGGGAATLKVADGVVYMVISVRNVGTGLAVMHGWHVEVTGQPQQTHPPLEDFTTQTRDIYVAPGDVGFWQGALRDPATAQFKAVAAAVEAGDPIMLSILYGDWEGGQRVISLFALRRVNDERWLTTTGRHFNVDRPDPR